MRPERAKGCQGEPAVETGCPGDPQAPDVGQVSTYLTQGHPAHASRQHLCMTPLSANPQLRMAAPQSSSSSLTPHRLTPALAPNGVPPLQLGLACFSALCRPPSPNSLALSFHNHQTLLRSKGMATLPPQAPWPPTFCVTLGSYSAAGASVSLLLH